MLRDWHYVETGLTSWAIQGDSLCSVVFDPEYRGGTQLRDSANNDNYGLLTSFVNIISYAAIELLVGGEWVNVISVEVVDD